VDKLEELANAKEQKFLMEHGAHEWTKHDLIQEASEEIVDAFSYIRAHEKLKFGDENAVFACTVIRKQLKSVFESIELLREIENGSKGT